MRERIASARSGAPTAYLDELALHSAFDPAAEAARFAAGRPPKSHARLRLFFAPCLDYLLPAYEAAYGPSPAIVVQCSEFFSPDRCLAQPEFYWTPASAFDLAGFLEAAVADSDADAVDLIEWRPAVTAYGRPAVDLLAEIRRTLQRLAANGRTVRALGRRWLRNAFRNSRRLPDSALLAASRAPIVVAAAGPSLESVLPVIAARQGEWPLIAVSSAVAALAEAGIEPDMVVATDGGNWASFHLAAAVRRGLAVAAPLTASLSGDGPFIALGDGSRWQGVVLAAFGAETPSWPQRGTVTATAVDLALALTSGPIVLAGLDLAPVGQRGHARPYALDRFGEAGAGRTRTFEAWQYDRWLSGGENGALRIYADWFAGHYRGAHRRLARLGPIHQALADLPDAAAWSQSEWYAGGRGPLWRPRSHTAVPSPDGRNLALTALESALAAEAESVRVSPNDTDDAAGLPPLLREVLELADYPAYLKFRRRPRSETADAYRLAVRRLRGLSGAAGFPAGRD
jgi:hypothetical protein